MLDVAECPNAPDEGLVDHDALLDGFHRAWASGTRPSVLTYIRACPRGAASDPDFAFHLLSIDLEHRLAARDLAPLVEDYLALVEFRSLGEDHRMHLARQEYVGRWSRGETGVSRDDYRTRFPAFAAEIDAWRPEWSCPSCRRENISLEGEAYAHATCPRCKATFPVELVFRPAPAFDTRDYPHCRAVGEGGMGRVFQTRDPALDRELAVKVMHEDYRCNREFERRFLREARITGRLQHPGIVPVHSLGRLPDGRLFYTMKLLEKGKTLEQLLHKPPPDDHAGADVNHLTVFLQVCEAVAYAHANQVVHRDLKPANIIVGEFGEVQVLDWGLAKVLDLAEGTPPTAHAASSGRAVHSPRNGDPAALTQARDVLGTPAYMPPEQARGLVEQVDSRADVFALGSILCELLTGDPAYTGRTADEILDKATRGELSDAFSRLDTCGADAEVVALAKSCLDVERGDRPAHAGVLVRQLTAHQAALQERLKANELARVRAEARAERATQQRRLAVALAASILILMALGGSGAFWYRQQQQARWIRFLAMTQRVAALRADAEGNPSGGATGWGPAIEAAREAEALAPDADSRRDASTALTDVEATARFLDRVVSIQVAAGEVSDAATVDAYAQAFAELGRTVAGSTHLAALTHWARGRPEALRVSLASALDGWARAAADLEDQGKSWHGLVALAREVDREPRRDRLRVAWLADDTELIQHIADTEAYLDDLTPPGLLLLTNTLDEDDDRDTMERILRRGLLRYPRDVWLNFALAELLEGRTTEARKEAIVYYRVAWILRPETGHRLAHILDHLGRADEAEAIFRELVRLQPGSPRDLGCFGDLLKQRGRISEAEDVLRDALNAGRRAVASHPDDADEHFSLGNALSAKGQLDEAIAEYREAIRLEPDFELAHAHLGLTLRAKGRLDEAIAEYREAIRLKPADAIDHNNLGLALSDKGRLDDAVAEYRTAIRLEPDLVNAHNNLGNALRAKGRLDEAVAEYREAIRLEPTDPIFHNNLGLALSDKGRLDDAVAEYRTAIRIKPDYASGHNNLGLALSNKGRLDDAVAEYREAIRIKPDYASAHNNLGLALSDEGRLDEAAAEYRAATNFAAAYEALGRWADAEPLLREDLARRRKSVEPNKLLLASDFAALGSNLLKQAKWAEAETVLRECLAIREEAIPDAWQRFNAMSLLGEALLGQGKYDEAESLVVPGYEGMKVRTASFQGRFWSRRRSDAARRIFKLYEAWGKPEQAAAWKAKLGLADLPADVFARP
jgi:serine/threonine-protein kinase